MECAENGTLLKALDGRGMGRVLTLVLSMVCHRVITHVRKAVLTEQKWKCEK